MPNIPDLDFHDADLFNKRVRELMRSYKKQHPHLSVSSRRSLAEAMAEPEFFQAQEKQERPC